MSPAIPSTPTSTSRPTSGAGADGGDAKGHGGSGPDGADPGPGLMRLHRRRHGRMVAGVASGLAHFFDVDPILVRIAFVALAVVGGLAVPVYLAGWLLIPDEESDCSVAEELLDREQVR